LALIFCAEAKNCARTALCWRHADITEHFHFSSSNYGVSTINPPQYALCSADAWVTSLNTAHSIRISRRQILDVKRDATQQQIQKSYRKLSLLYHPDKHPGDEKAAKKFEDVKTAYEVLSDPEKRQSSSVTAFAFVFFEMPWNPSQRHVIPFS
jgi:hypothetical protein